MRGALNAGCDRVVKKRCMKSMKRGAARGKGRKEKVVDSRKIFDEGAKRKQPSGEHGSGKGEEAREFEGGGGEAGRGGTDQGVEDACVEGCGAGRAVWDRGAFGMESR